MLCDRNSVRMAWIWPSTTCPEFLWEQSRVANMLLAAAYPIRELQAVIAERGLPPQCMPDNRLGPPEVL